MKEPMMNCLNIEETILQQIIQENKDKPISAIVSKLKPYQGQRKKH